MQVARLFDEHAGMVLGLCRLILRDHHEAEDAAQQTFVSAYRSLLRGSEPRDEAPWLAAIARNECRARMRRRMRSPVALEGELDEQLADPTDILDEADRRAEMSALTAAIAELPARQREAVTLRDFLGLSYEEVASTLSVSVPVVESLLFRARRRLRETIRTVPRYAAGLVALPFTIRASLSRELPELDGLGFAGAAGAAGAALAGVAAKAISLPFASKAVTAVTVIAVATVGPQLGGEGGTGERPVEIPVASGLPAGPQAPIAAPRPGAKGEGLDEARPQVEAETSSPPVGVTEGAAPSGAPAAGGPSEGHAPQEGGAPGSAPGGGGEQPELDPTRELVAAAPGETGAAPQAPGGTVESPPGDEVPSSGVQPDPAPPEAEPAPSPAEPPVSGGGDPLDQLPPGAVPPGIQLSPEPAEPASGGGTPDAPLAGLPPPQPGSISGTEPGTALPPLDLHPGPGERPAHPPQGELPPSLDGSPQLPPEGDPLP